MKAVIIYHPDSESARKVEEFVYEFEKRTGHTMDLISLETQEGAELARVYDVVRYPAILTIRDNGELLKNWEGEELPLINEVTAYVSA